MKKLGIVVLVLAMLVGCRDYTLNINPIVSHVDAQKTAKPSPKPTCFDFFGRPC